MTQQFGCTISESLNSDPVKQKKEVINELGKRLAVLRGLHSARGTPLVGHRCSASQWLLEEAGRVAVMKARNVQLCQLLNSLLGLNLRIMRGAIRREGSSNFLAIIKIFFYQVSLFPP